MSDPETTLPKTFDPAAIEARWYAHWEDNGLFRPARPDAEPFTLVNPPPNVTGSLHIGHALDNTLQDIVIRYKRLRGKDALWVVGTDHAGIATQMVVERNLASQGLSRSEIGREAFLQHVWEWKAQSGGTITRQLRRLGCSMDWSREQFTMDPHFSRAVTHTFVRLYNEGLIYRDKRLVNWDPKLKTAISDLEVETREVSGKFWHIRYPLEEGIALHEGRDHIVVATTRPETMLADMAVAVHPEDERYRSVIGKHVRLPITGRLVPIVGDEHADPELGSGAVKITPGHDFNDFEVGRRAGFKAAGMLNMLDAEARIVQCGGIPDELVGLDRFDARERVVALLAEQGLLENVEDRVIPTPFGDRSGVVIEPWLTDQWYVDAEKLARAPLEAVRNGAIEIVPKSWEKTFFNWMENIQPWCVSRQLWWGHRIPAWYVEGTGVTGIVIVAQDEAAAMAGAKEMFPTGTPIRFGEIGESSVDFDPGNDGGWISLYRDPDVLDTWFSSALWPFATLGWPDENAPLLARRYPNDLLVSGFDILFFWDARMAMMGMHLLGPERSDPADRVPWKRLYLHGLVRAADGQKMSKSKGNVVDPLGLIDRYGADALRFFMAAMESQGRDVKLDEKRVEGYRNFATKLWNAARFCQSNGIAASRSLAGPPATLAVNKWIVGEVVETLAALDGAMAELRFDAAANAIYHFVWDTFCDWYLELIKGEMDEETRTVAGWVLDQILVMLHPFMPFVTEELWQALTGPDDQRPYELIVAKWPEPEAQVDAEAKREMEWLIRFVTDIRSTKVALDAGAKPMTVFVSRAHQPQFGWLNKNLLSIKRLTRASQISVRTDAGLREIEKITAGTDFDLETLLSVEGEGEVQLVAEGIEGQLNFFGDVDLDAARTRLAKARAAALKERDALAKRLANPAFVEKAKPEAVEKARADHGHHAAEAERLEAALARLG
jgi:valyl-tRNA synthetase